MTQPDALKSAEFLLAPSMHADHKVWAHRELSGDYAVGVAWNDGTWVSRFTAKSYASAVKRIARLIIETMPDSECASRAQTYLNGGR